MSVKLMSQVWQHKFDHGQQAVLLVMADHANDDGESCFPSIPLIAWKTGYSGRQVTRILQTLVEAKILAVAAPATNRRPTEYTIHLDKAPCKPERRGVTMSPQDKRRGDTVSPQEIVRGDISTRKMRSRGDISTSRGDIAMSPDPSIELTTTGSTNKKRSSPAGEAPPPPIQDSAPDPQPPTPQQAYFDALCWVVGWDAGVITKDQRGQVAQTMGILQKQKYSIDDLRRFWQDVWLKDFRWRKEKARPTLVQLRGEIGKLRAGEREITGGGDGSGSEPTEEEFRRQYHAAQPRGKRPGLDAQREAAAGGAGLPMPHLQGHALRDGVRAGDSPQVRQGDPLPLPGIGGPGTASVVPAGD